LRYALSKTQSDTFFFPITTSPRRMSRKSSPRQGALSKTQPDTFFFPKLEGRPRQRSCATA
jgi:hypothetical protein